MIHSRAAEEDTFAVLDERARDLTVVMHCFSAPDWLDHCVERGYFCSFAGNVTYPGATDLQDAARAVPDDLLLVETDAPYLSPQAVRRESNEPANVVADGRVPRGPARGLLHRPREARSRATRRASFGGERRGEPAADARVRDLAEPRARAELPRRRQPAGRNRARGRARSRDVVLEVGGGLGVLSEYLAARVGHLHVVEVDRRLAPPLEQALDPFSNTTLHLSDALDLDLGVLDPTPDKVVANLPYGVAATVVIDTVMKAPDVVLWVAMVQREVAERLAAKPGSRIYGATSAIVGLCCEVKLVRRVGPGVFHPRPNVESALVRLVRRAPPPAPGLVALVHAAFAHRRKTLSGSLALAPNAAPGIREAARAALEGIGHAGRRTRGAACTPGFRGARRGARTRVTGVSRPMSATRESAPAKVNLILQVGGRRANGLHEICSLFGSIELADELTIGEAEADSHEIVCDGVTGENIARAALARFEAALGRPLEPLRVRIEKRIPVAAGLGGGSADAAAVLRVANRRAGNPFDRERLRAIAAEVGADVPSQVHPANALVTGMGEEVEEIGLPSYGLVLLPHSRGLSTAAVYAEADRIAACRIRLDPEAVRARAALGADELASGLENDLERAAVSLLPEIEAALAALRAPGPLAARVTGSGPTCFGVFGDREAAALAARSIEPPPGFGPAIVTAIRQNS